MFTTLKIITLTTLVSLVSISAAMANGTEITALTVPAGTIGVIQADGHLNGVESNCPKDANCLFNLYHANIAVTYGCGNSLGPISYAKVRNVNGTTIFVNAFEYVNKKSLAMMCAKENRSFIKVNVGTSSKVKVVFVGANN